MNDDLVKSRFPPSRSGVAGGDEPCTIWYRVKGRGINNSMEFLDSSPSPLPCGVLKLTPQGKPSPVKGEGVFLTFYDFINNDPHKSRATPASPNCSNVFLHGFPLFGSQPMSLEYSSTIPLR